MSEEGFGSSIPQGLKQRGRGFRRGPDLQCQKGLEEKEELQRKLLNHVYVRIECEIFHGTILNRADVEKQSISHLITLMYSEQAVAGWLSGWMAFWILVLSCSNTAISLQPPVYYCYFNVSLGCLSSPMSN